MFKVRDVHFEPESRESMGKWTRTTFQGKEKECWFCNKCGTRLYHHCPGQEMFTVNAGALLELSKEMLDGATHIWAKVSLAVGRRLSGK